VFALSGFFVGVKLALRVQIIQTMEDRKALGHKPVGCHLGLVRTGFFCLKVFMPFAPKSSNKNTLKIIGLTSNSHYDLKLPYFRLWGRSVS